MHDRELFHVLFQKLANKNCLHFRQFYGRQKDQLQCLHGIMETISHITALKQTKVKQSVLLSYQVAQQKA